jgi:hypothetical protein
LVCKKPAVDACSAQRHRLAGRPAQRWSPAGTDAEPLAKSFEGADAGRRYTDHQVTGSGTSIKFCQEQSAIFCERLMTTGSRDSANAPDRGVPWRLPA